MRRAKILATLGPASTSRETITAMLRAGLNAVRINMSHGSYEEHANRISLAREIATELGRPMSVLVDLSGPKIRTRDLENGAPVPLKEGSKFTLTTRDVTGTVDEVSTNFKELPNVVEPGARI